jgi:hypothetical protein
MISGNLNANNALINRNNRSVGASTNSNPPQFFNRVSSAYDNGLTMIKQILERFRSENNSNLPDLLSYLPDELLLEVAKNLSPKAYKHLSEVSSRFKDLLIGELYKDGNEQVFNNLINLLFKGRVVSKKLEGQLVALYLLTVGEQAIDSCRVYELNKGDKEITGIDYFLEYQTEPFRNWLDEHQITIAGYDECIQRSSLSRSDRFEDALKHIPKPVSTVSFKLENLIAIIDDLEIDIDKYQLDFGKLLSKVDSGLDVGEFIKLKTSDVLVDKIKRNCLKSAYSNRVAWMILNQHGVENIKLGLNDRVYYKGLAFMDNAERYVKDWMLDFCRTSPRTASVAGIILILSLVIALVSALVYYWLGGDK